MSYNDTVSALFNEVNADSDRGNELILITLITKIKEENLWMLSI
jgi:hypothetical protein